MSVSYEERVLNASRHSGYLLSSIHLCRGRHTPGISVSLCRSCFIFGFLLIADSDSERREKRAGAWDRQGSYLDGLDGFSVGPIGTVTSLCDSSVT